MLTTAQAVSGLALAGSSPRGDMAAGWPTSGGWTPYSLSDGAAVMDVRNDAHPSYTDVTSGPADGSLPSVYTAWDGTNLFFRVRLNANPASSQGGFESAIWLAQVAVGGSVTAVTGVHGKSPSSDSVFVARGNGSQLTPIYEHPFTDESAGARSLSDGNGGYFLDWQVPLARLSAASSDAVSSGASVQLFFGTTAANNVSVINKDYMAGSSVSFAGLGSLALPGSVDPTSDPDPTTNPDPTAGPDPTAEPNPTTDPDPSTDPDPATDLDPSTDPEPEVVADPQPSDDPSAGPQPEATDGLTPTTPPDAITDPEPTADPQPGIDAEPPDDGQPVQEFVPAPVATSDPAPRDLSVAQPESGHGAGPQRVTVSAAAEPSGDAATKSPAGAGWSVGGGPFVALLLGLLFLLLLVRRRRREERQAPELEPGLT